MNDWELLERYARNGAEDAFSELVSRHLNFVYSAAKRQTGSPHLAEDVTQFVFIELARQANRLRPGTSLPSWLYLVTRRMAINAVRAEMRRRSREHAAFELSAMNAPSPEWSRIEPLIDEAVAGLSEPDRSAVLMRYFEDRSLREVGAYFGISDDAAQKRLSRAIDHLRNCVLRRGVAVSAAAIATNLSAHATEIAPATLGATVSTGVAIQSVVGPTTALTMTTVQKTLATAALAAAIGAGIYENRVAARQDIQITAINEQVAALRLETANAKDQRDAARSRIGAAVSTPAPTAAAAEDAGLRSAMAALAEKTALIRQLIDSMPERKIPELGLLSDDDWVSISKDLVLGTDLQNRAAASQIRSRAKTNFRTATHAALARYQKDNGPDRLPSIDALAPYFEPPMPAEILARYTTDLSEMMNPAYLVAEKQTLSVDDDYDTRIQISLRGSGTDSVSKTAGIYRAALQQFAAANSGAKPTAVAQIRPYVPPQISDARLAELFGDPVQAAAGIQGTLSLGGAPSVSTPTGGGGFTKKVEGQ